MTDARSALEQAVLRDPADVAPRHVLADLLLESGDPRGELIQLQLQRARPSVDQRIRALLHTHERAWTHELRRIGNFGESTPSGERRWRFRGGFLEWIRLHASELRLHGPALRASAPIRALSLTGVSAADLSWLAEPGMLEHVVELELRATDAIAPERVAAMLAALPSGALRSLALRGRIRPGVAEAIAASPAVSRLVELVLDNHVSAEEPGSGTGPALAASPYLGHLERLALPSMALGPEGCTALVRSASVANLVRLDLTHCSPGKALAELTNGASPRLRELSIGGAHVTRGYLRTFAAGGSSLRELASFTMTDVQLGPEGVEALPFELPALTSLVLRRCTIEAGAAAALAGCRGLRQLTALDLSDNPLEDAGAVAIARSRVFERLARLRLASARLGAAGARSLALSPIMHTVTELDLADNHVGEDGIDAIGSAPGLRALRSLRIAGAPHAHLLVRHQTLAKLRELRLSVHPYDSHVHEASWEIATRPTLASLETLELAGIRPGVLEQLARAPHLAGLRRLILRRYSVDEDDAIALAESPLDLDVLDLSNASVALEAGAVLRKRYWCRFGTVPPIATFPTE